MSLNAIGLERLCEVRAAVRDAGGDASVVISGFERRERVYPHTVENSRELARFAAHH